jgi:tetratricopeptide (TPR) repeat protein
MTDIFDMQDDIAAKIMAALEIHLGTDKSSRKRPTENMLAYEKFLAARALSSQEQWDSLKSINLLKEAVSLDPSFAEAWEFLAMEYWLKAGVKTLSQNESAILCLDAAEKALALDPSLSIAAAMEFSANPEKGTWHGEIKMLKKAYQEHPDYPLVAIALVADLFSTGYFTEALSYAEHLVTIDPLSPAAQSTYAAALYAVGRIKEADAASQRAADLGEPWGLFDLFISQMLSGDLEAAIVAYESFLKSVGKDPAGAKDWVRAASDPDTGRQFLLDALENQYRGFSDGRWSVFFAFGYLDDFYDELEYNIHPDMIWYDAEPIIFSAMYHRRSGVSAHPRYLPAMELMTITDTWDELGPPDHCNKDSGEWVCN